jgi:hypothetical protein
VLTIFAFCDLLLISAAIGAIAPPLLFGPDGFLRGWTALIWAEAAPAGNPSFLQMDSQVDDFGARLRHSAIYDDDVVMECIKTAILSRSS